MFFMEEKEFVNSVLHVKVIIKSSETHGHGLFAIADIEKDTLLHVTHVHKELINKEYISCEWVNLKPNNRYNHSKEKENCKIVTDHLTKGIVTLRDITQGEELLVDYTKDLTLEQPECDWKS